MYAPLMYQRSTVHTASGRAAGRVSGLCTQSPALLLLFEPEALMVVIQSATYAGKKIAVRWPVMGNFFSITRPSCFARSEIVLFSVCDHYYFDKNVRLDTFSVGTAHLCAFSHRVVDYICRVQRLVEKMHTFVE